MDTCEVPKRHTLMHFEHEGRRYRLIGNIINQGHDLEIFVEQFMYNAENKEKSEVWLKVDPDVIDKNHMTLEQCANVLKMISEFVNRNYLMV